MSSQSKWVIKPHDPQAIQKLSSEANVSALVAHLLINRGIDKASAVIPYFSAPLSGLHDPAKLPGVLVAADRIIAAINANEKIVIYGDYDVDGVCGTSVLWACLKLAGAKHVEYYIPHRLEEGYGVNGDAVRKFAQEDGVKLIVTVDCGISAVNEAALARELGIDLIITDHHTIGSELPDAFVLVHPRLEGTEYPFGELCGCGVAFKLAWEIARRFGDGKKASPALREFLVDATSLVAMATVADVVPLRDENRILVRRGLETIKTQPSVGLHALMEVSDSLNKPVTSYMIGFQLGPRINAAGRLEAAMQAVDMLTTRDRDLARSLANHLNECNLQRQEVERTIVAEAKAMVEADGKTNEERGGIVLACEGWHPGVIGIVASRIVDTYHRPTIVIGIRDGVGQGSARSVEGFDLHEAIKVCSEDLIRFGGHPAAAGLKVKAEFIDSFREKFNAQCLATLTPTLKSKTIVVDAEVRLGELTLSAVEQIERMEPFGLANPKPILLASRVQVVDAKTMGKTGEHLQARFAQGNNILRAIGWGMGGKAADLTPGSICDIVFEPKTNEWNERKSVQMLIRDIEVI